MDMLPPLDILLVEDNPINQKVAARLLEKAGHSVTVAGNGREALDQVSSNPYDLILMDVQMPEMDGLQATVAIREQEAGTDRHIPIVALTAHAMVGDRERCLGAGMDGYVTKPVQPPVLFQAIADALGVAPESA
jgi:CheY-like chemotaxis protein